ncbi:hypothetical protein AAG906_020784 [Vitis piasezkii]
MDPTFAWPPSAPPSDPEPHKRIDKLVKLGRDQGEVLAEALKIMLCDDRQHNMQKAAAFIKQLATFSLCLGSTESMAALVTLKYLLQKKC